MAKLKEDKKREIIEFLEDTVADEYLLSLESDRIATEFADERFDEESIKEIIDELEEDDLLITKTARLEVVYPSSHKDTIESKFEDLFEQSIFAIYFVGTVSLLILLAQEGVFTTLFEDVLDDPEALVNQAIILGVLGAYVVGKALLAGHEMAQKQFEVVREYRYLLYPTFTIGMVTAGVTYLYASYASQPITPGTVVQLVSVSILGGVALGKLFFEEN